MVSGTDKDIVQSTNEDLLWIQAMRCFRLIRVA
jgi:hypothetical protein